ncbi:MAG TPA: hypothetical protein VFF15_09450 [Flavobacteriaceae bacterium]|nr:hypothetical protein [Flavobacteriaceae bacterium]
MSTIFLLNGYSQLILIEQISIVTMLAIVVVFFLILLIAGVIKTYKLKKENDRLNDINPLQSDDENKAYKDFRDGHLYE